VGDTGTCFTVPLVSFKKYMSPPLPYFKENICPFPLPHFASIFFAYLWSFCWPNYRGHIFFEWNKGYRETSACVSHYSIDAPGQLLQVSVAYWAPIVMSVPQKVLKKSSVHIFLFSTATFKYKYRAPLRRIGQEYSAKVAFSIFQSLKRIQPLLVCWNGYSHFRSGLNWFRKYIKCALNIKCQ
jgi:hypothetical protein